MMMRINRALSLALTFMMLSGAGWGQSGGYLAQKLMVENNLRKRITDALEKIIDNRKYVVDVSVDLELSSAVEEQTTFKSGPPEGVDQEMSPDLLEETQIRSKPDRSSGVGLPIPGFDFETEAPPKIEEPTAEPDQAAPTQNYDNKVLSRTHTEKHPALAIIRNMEISIILQEGAAPELIENIRQVVMVASRFNRARGDVLSIMTASFKERRDEKTAEQVLLKNIAEKLESLESQRERLGEVDWKEEMKTYKEEEAERRQEDRLYFQSKLAELESNAKDRAYEQQKQDILREDSIRLAALNEEIQNLKTFLGAGDVSDSAAIITETSIQQKLSEKSSLDNQIAEKLAMLETVQADLDRAGSGGNSALLIFISILGALVIVLVVVLAFVLLNKPKQQIMPPPPWMYPPRPKKKSKSVSEKPVKTEAPPPSKPTPSPEDIAVLQSEVNDMKQAVVSMSVGQPSAAQRIVKEWIQEEAPPEPEEPTPPPQAPEEESGKKKKKKK